MSRDDIKFKVFLRDGARYACLLATMLRTDYDLTCSIPLQEGGELVHFSYHPGRNHFYIIYDSGKRIYETESIDTTQVALHQITSHQRVVSWIWSGDMVPLKWKNLSGTPDIGDPNTLVLELNHVQPVLPLAIDLWFIGQTGNSAMSELYRGVCLEDHVIDRATVSWNGHSISCVIWPITPEKWANTDFSDRVASVVADSRHGIMVAYRSGDADMDLGTLYDRVDYAYKSEGQWLVGAALGDAGYALSWVAPFMFIDAEKKVQCYVKDRAGIHVHHTVVRQVQEK